MFLTKKFTFDSAHHLTKYKGKCGKPHGHTYTLLVTVEGEIKKNGMVMDFLDLKKLVQSQVLDRLDHSDLNDIFDNSTAENICEWIWKKLESLVCDFGVRLYEVEVWETSGSRVKKSQITNNK